ncbi:hypothetical protein BD311DRAFT_843099 [Dichomitus squalens]|uniref:Uncharacterized protein n=1 Tax=Dichomitus squalens TaxID=114155 RepID=A0A4Q9MNE6_9APHY|nr:hypothetical protein BD311DRAFT_843099 [Dichomitus squalens]
MERLFSVLVESGMVYCIIWIDSMFYLQIFVVAWQVHAGSAVQGEPTFDGKFGYSINGGLVPVIAIYPTDVIILVAQNRPLMDKAFGGGAVNAPEPSCLGGIRVSSATVLHIARQGVQVRDGSEESSMHTADERKMESSGVA